MSAIDALLGKKPQVVRHDICLDPDLGDEFHKARQRKQRAEKNAAASPDDADLGAEAADAQDAYDAALAAVKDRVACITFQAIDPQELDRIAGEHRPTEEQKREAQRQKVPPPEWNTDTFAPVLIATACLRIESPDGDAVGLSIEDAQRLWTSPTYNKVERAEIFNAAVSAQMKTTRLGDIPKG